VREFDVATLLAGGRADGHRRARAGARGLAYLRSLWGAPRADRRWGRWSSEFAATVGPWDGLLQSDDALAALRELDPASRPHSPSALQTFVDCPFAYYVRYILGMRPPEEPAEAAEIDAGELGTVAHDILQATFAEIGPQSGSSAEALAVLRRVAAARCKRAEDEGVAGLPLAWQARRRMLLDDLSTAVRLDLEGLQNDDRRPWQFEWPFGAEVERPVRLELGGRHMELRGRVDRFDRSADGARVRLIDYKTGGGDAERRSLRGGRNAQLAAYMLAAQQALEPRPAEVACEFRFVTRRGAFRTLSPADDAATVAATFSTLVTRVVAAIEGGLFVRSSEDQRCRYCDLAYACGVGHWARERKRGDESVRPIRELQSGNLRDLAADA
jgi:RecB family exonuclease